MPAQRGSSYAPGRRPGSGGGRPGNAIQQQYALSGKATLADIPYLYGMPGGMAGGGQEKDGGGFGGFEGEPALGADMGAGPGSAGGVTGSPSGLPGSGGLPVIPDDLAGPQTRTVFARPTGGGGEGGNSDVAGQRAVDSLGFGAADLTAENVMKGIGFGLGIAGPTGGILTGVQAMGHLAAPDLIDSPMPEFTGAFKPENYLSASEIQQLASATTLAEAARIKAGLMAKAQQRFDAERFAGRDARIADIGNAAVDRLADPAQTGFSGPAGPVGAAPGTPGSGPAGFGPGTLAGVGERAGLMDRTRAAGRGGNASGGGRGPSGGGVGSSRARSAGDAPGGPRGGPMI